MAKPRATGIRERAVEREREKRAATRTPTMMMMMISKRGVQPECMTHKMPTVPHTPPITIVAYAFIHINICAYMYACAYIRVPFVPRGYYARGFHM